MIQLSGKLLPRVRVGLVAGFCIILSLQSTGGVQAQSDTACVVLERLVPPRGLDIPDAQKASWQSQLNTLERRAIELQSPLEADIAVLLKACRYAIEFQELYQAKDFAKVDRLLALAEQRLNELTSGEASWTAGTGRQVRGFRSRVDGSAQPLGLVLPELPSDSNDKFPLYVWLHGRGDKTTDLHFLCERLDKDGQIVPEGAIVVHPFGRQCIGYKSAGETDVMEAIEFVCANYPVDRERIVLMGFSMGGAGVWHLAAHYGEHFVAASSGAGFAETARYQRLTPEKYPPKYEQVLWSIYDVPGYTRNLFNLPFVAYSGENDKQIQAARVMEEAFLEEGRELAHLIGPGMGHKYHPDTLADIMRRMNQAVVAGKPSQPKQLFIQTKHPRYSARSWITIDGAQVQYIDTRVDAARLPSLKSGGDGWNLQTKNVSRLVLDCVQIASPQGVVEIDGQTLGLVAKGENRLQRSASGVWEVVDSFPSHRKRPGMSGPIDDAFIDPFLVVLPTGKSSHARVDQWVDCELEYFQQRWKSLFRGELRIKRDSEVTEEDIARYHLVLWGTPESNLVIRKILGASGVGRLPVQWDSKWIRLENERQTATDFDAVDHVALMIYPNPMAPNRYVVLNSGPTFRTAHDRTNSLQNPHLPDWVIISLDEPRSAERSGRVERAGFFGNAWEWNEALTW